MCVLVPSYIKVSDEGLPGGEAERQERSFRVAASMSAQGRQLGGPHCLKRPHVIAEVGLLLAPL